MERYLDSRAQDWLKAVEKEVWEYREERPGFAEGNSLGKAVADSGSQDKSPVVMPLLRAPLGVIPAYSNSPSISIRRKR